MSPEKKIQVFKNELNLIQGNVVKKLTMLALEKVNDKFFYAPASSTGKHHPKFARQVYGTVNHTKVAVLYTCFLINLDHNHITDEEKDLAIAATILHDTCKMGIDFEKDHTVLMHPMLVENLLTPLELKGFVLDTWRDINKIISTHMGQWTTSNKEEGELPIPETKLQKLVHTADFLASREELGDIETWLRETSPARIKQYATLNDILTHKEVKNNMSILELKNIRRQISEKSLNYLEAKNLIIKLSCNK